MSHFTKLDRAQITDVNAFLAALAEQGFTQVRRNVKIRDFYDNEVDVDVAVVIGSVGGKEYSIALKINAEGKYDLIADWWGCRNVLTNAGFGDGGFGSAMDPGLDGKLQDLVLRNTTKHAIVARYKAKGFRAEIFEDENFNINVKLRRA